MVWIEIQLSYALQAVLSVTTLVVVWIEIGRAGTKSSFAGVTTLVVVWIEILGMTKKVCEDMGHHSRSGVD